MVPLAGVAMLDPAEPMTGAIRQTGTWGYGLVLSGRELVGMLGPEEVRRAVELGKARRAGRNGWAAGPPPPPVGFPDQQWQAPGGSH
jgi:hypothetical protein